MASWLSSAGVDDRMVICTISRANSCSAWRDWFQAGGERNSTAGKLFAILLCSAFGFPLMRTTSGSSRWLSSWTQPSWPAGKPSASHIGRRDGDFRTIEGLALVESPDPIPPEESASGRRYAPRTLAASASQLCACR